MSLLDKLLAKRGIAHIEELDTEERAVFDRYAAVLRGDTVTIDTLKAFCKAQISVIESACNGKDPLTMMQQACLHVYINLIKAIEAPEAERESLEQYLTQLIK